jgi:hypothetical protein
VAALDGRIRERSKPSAKLPIFLHSHHSLVAAASFYRQIEQKPLQRTAISPHDGSRWPNKGCLFYWEGAMDIALMPFLSADLVQRREESGMYYLIQ